MISCVEDMDLPKNDGDDEGGMVLEGFDMDEFTAWDTDDRFYMYLDLLDVDASSDSRLTGQERFNCLINSGGGMEARRPVSHKTSCIQRRGLVQ